jgi:heme exporter protein B
VEAVSVVATPSLPRGLPPSYARHAWLVLRKDLAIERRTGEIVTTSGFFAILVAVLASLAFSFGEGQKTAAPGVMWISVTFAAVLALGRTWHREREESALLGLLVSPLPRSAIFLGKMLGVLVFLFAIEALVVPVTALLFSIDLLKMGPGLGLIALAATPGIAASGTLFGVMTVRTRARDLVLASVLVPLLSPTLLTAVAATRDLLGGAALGELGDYAALLLAFDAVFLAGGLAMFGSLVES